MNDQNTAAEDLEDIVAFLCGEKPLDGTWFGETPTDKLPFWWRTKLRHAIAAEKAALCDQFEQIIEGGIFVNPALNRGDLLESLRAEQRQQLAQLRKNNALL